MDKWIQEIINLFCYHYLKTTSLCVKTVLNPQFYTSEDDTIQQV